MGKLEVFCHHSAAMDLQTGTYFPVQLWFYFFHLQSPFPSYLYIYSFSIPLFFPPKPWLNIIFLVGFLVCCIVYKKYWTLVGGKQLDNVGSKLMIKFVILYPETLLLGILLGLLFFLLWGISSFIPLHIVFFYRVLMS